MRLVDHDLCSFCKTDSENILHVFYECQTVSNFWQKVENFINSHFDSNLRITKYSVMFGSDSNTHIVNHILLLAKRFIYISSLQQISPSFDRFLTSIKDICKIEQFIANKNNRYNDFEKKWKELPLTIL